MTERGGLLEQAASSSDESRTASCDLGEFMGDLQGFAVGPVGAGLRGGHGLVGGGLRGLQALSVLALGFGVGFGGLRVARALRAYVLEERRHPPQWLKAAGYWKRSHAGTEEKFD